MGGLQFAILALAGAALVGAEVFDEPCYDLGKQWVYEAKDTLLCDRTGRRINLNKFCKAHLSSASGRLIIDSSKDDGPTEVKKQAGHFPELCLPGQRSYAVQAPWLCTCVVYKNRNRWECVVPENGAGRGLGSDNPNSRSKRSLSADGTTPAPLASPSSTPSLLEEGHLHDHNATVRGRQQAPTLKPNIIIDFCDEFGYVHSVSSSIKECACDRDVIATKLFSVKENDLYPTNGLFSSYECLPGTYNVRCEVCYPDTHQCQPAPCL